MQVNSGDPIKKVIDQWEFTFANAIPLSVTLDLELGDEIKFYEDSIQINLVAKPSPLNPKNILGAEDITILLNNLLAYHHRRQEVIGPSIDEQLELSNLIHEMTDTVN